MNSVCVLMSVYKYTRFLELIECLKSLVDDENLHLFIFVDGPVDINVKLYIHDLYKSGKIKYLYISKKNLGLARGLNVLIHHGIVNGYKFFMRMDTDDISVVGRCQQQVKFLIDNPDIDIVGGFIEEFGAFNGIVKYPLNHDEIRSSFSRRNTIGHVTVMFRASYFLKSGFYPESTNLDEDTYLWMNGFLKGSVFANLPEVLVKVRVDSDFIKRRQNVKKFFDDLYTRYILVKRLSLSKKEYVWIFLRFVYLLLPSKLKKLVYRKIKY